MDKKIFQDCHQEKIQYLNEIQSFGYILGVNKSNLEINFYSENVWEIFPEAPENLIDLPLRNFYDFDIDFSEVEKLEVGEFFRTILVVNNTNYHLTVYHVDELYYIELEDFLVTENRLAYYNFSEQILYSKNIEENWRHLVDAVKKLSGFDRVMVYKFLEDKTGVVIEENVDEGLDSFLGLRFPEFDIPKQARHLYLKKKSRLVADINGKRIPIISKDKKSIDLTYTSVRSLSKIHLEYLKNIDAHASFSISIVINDNLWGMLACQNTEAKEIPYQVRLQAELLTRLARMSYVNFRSNEKIQFQNHFNEAAIRLKENLLVEESLQESIKKNLKEIQELTDADGMALVNQDIVFVEGETPQNDEILRIKQWAIEQEINQLYFSNTFRREFGEELNLTNFSTGVMFGFLDQHCRNFIIWFKKEEVVKQKWAGQPNKIEKEKVIDDVKTIYYSPRTSFKIWEEEVKGRSYIWDEREVFVAKEVIKLIIETLHIQSFKIHSLYEQLKEINEELDSFSYTVSHDLRTPLTVMKLNCQLLQKRLKDDDFNVAQLKNVIQEIDRITEMMHDILAHSKAKKSEIVLSNIETKPIIEKIVNDVKIYYEVNHCKVEMDDFDEVLGDKTMVYEVFLNIIGNAIKYSSTQEKPKVKISSFKENGQVIFEVKDNGIGIKKDDFDKMFKLFSRMSNTGNISGNGVGLSIANRMMNRMNGEIDFLSKENEGSTFILKFKKP